MYLGELVLYDPYKQIIPAPCIPVGGTESAYHRAFNDPEVGGDIKLAYWMDSVYGDAVNSIVDYWWGPEWT